MKTQLHTKVLIQILIWFLAWTTITFFLTNAWNSPERFLHRTFIHFIGMTVIIIATMYVLLPQLYFKNKAVLFLIAGIVLIFCIQEIIYWEQAPWYNWVSMPMSDQRRSQNPMGNRPKGVSPIRYIGRMIPMIIAFMGSSLWVISDYARKKETELLSIAKEKLESDVKFLKSQINPHFLFNALNNIYSLSILKSDKTPESVMSLSDMLRYMLYESDVDKVPLQKELDYLNNFVQLQLLKDSRGLNVTIDTAQANPRAMVAPLLFIPFVENAFKHSHIENLKDGFINMKLSTDEKSIDLFIKNSLPMKPVTKDKVGGIGMQNVKNRLELLYPNAHQLEIITNDKTYTIKLRIEI